MRRQTIAVLPVHLEWDVLITYIHTLYSLLCYAMTSAFWALQHTSKLLAPKGQFVSKADHYPKRICIY